MPMAFISCCLVLSMPERLQAVIYCIWAVLKQAGEVLACRLRVREGVCADT